MAAETPSIQQPLSPAVSNRSSLAPAPGPTVRHETRNRVVEIIAQTANGCLQELGYSPAMLDRERFLVDENTQLKETNTNLLAERERLIQQINDLKAMSSRYRDENVQLFDDNTVLQNRVSGLEETAGMAHSEVIARHASEKSEILRNYAILQGQYQTALKEIKQFSAFLAQRPARGTTSGQPINPNAHPSSRGQPQQPQPQASGSRHPMPPAFLSNDGQMHRAQPLPSQHPAHPQSQLQQQHAPPQQKLHPQSLPNQHYRVHTQQMQRPIVIPPGVVLPAGMVQHIPQQPPQLLGWMSNSTATPTLPPTPTSAGPHSHSPQLPQPPAYASYSYSPPLQPPQRSQSLAPAASPHSGAYPPAQLPQQPVRPSSQSHPYPQQAPRISSMPTGISMSGPLHPHSPVLQQQQPTRRDSNPFPAGIHAPPHLQIHHSHPPPRQHQYGPMQPAQGPPPLQLPVRPTAPSDWSQFPPAAGAMQLSSALGLNLTTFASPQMQHQNPAAAGVPSESSLMTPIEGVPQTQAQVSLAQTTAAVQGGQPIAMEGVEASPASLLETHGETVLRDQLVATEKTIVAPPIELQGGTSPDLRDGDTPQEPHDSDSDTPSEPHEAITPPPTEPESLKRASPEGGDTEVGADARKRHRVAEPQADLAAEVKVEDVELKVVDESKTIFAPLDGEDDDEEEEDEEDDEGYERDFIETDKDGKRTVLDCLKAIFDRKEGTCKFCSHRKEQVEGLPVDEPPRFLGMPVEELVTHCETEHLLAWNMLRENA